MLYIRLELSKEHEQVEIPNRECARELEKTRSRRGFVAGPFKDGQVEILERE